MVAAMLHQRLVAAGVDARVLSAGLRASGEPPTDKAERLLAGHGVNVSRYRSTSISRGHVKHAGLIVCAEVRHVVSIAGEYPGSFGRCFTLPEVVRLGERVGPRGGEAIGGWLDRIGRLRVSPMDYLDAKSSDAGEIADPTGKSPSTWDATFAEIDDLTRRLARLLT